MCDEPIRYILTLEAVDYKKANMEVMNQILQDNVGIIILGSEWKIKSCLLKQGDQFQYTQVDSGVDNE